MTDPPTGTLDSTPGRTPVYAAIRRLPDAVVREIAAGEVVTAPADALRELVDNALDAGASRLAITLDEGGRERMVVRDNGRGIPRDQLPLAAEAHCTSKLDSLTRIATLGFRGEGLYALRNAARLRLTSRPADQLGGATLDAHGDELSLSSAPAPAGTSAELSELFVRLPARRAALGTPAQETRACLAVLGRVLLHHPELLLTVVTDGEERWSYAGGGVLDAVRFLWGPVTANRLLNVERRSGDWLVEGALSRPELSRPRRDRLLLAVNGRPVAWPEALLRALVGAYRELLPSGQLPVGVLDLTLPPERVLVNTAPDKSRVRLLDEAEVAAFVGDSVAEALARHPLAPALPTPAAFEAVGDAPRSAFPPLRHLGSFRELYLLAEGDGRLWVVDQHAAHERVIFEELERRFREEPPVEMVSPEAGAPELITLAASDTASYRERRDALAARGLELEPFGGERWRVRRVPAFLLGRPQLVADLVRGSLAGQTLDDAWRAVLGRFACLPAVKAGHALADADAQTLLDALRRCHTPWACPHGRPTALVLSELELARRFGRRGVRAVARSPVARD